MIDICKSTGKAIHTITRYDGASRLLKLFFPSIQTANQIAFRSDIIGGKAPCFKVHEDVLDRFFNALEIFQESPPKLVAMREKKSMEEAAELLRIA